VVAAFAPIAIFVGASSAFFFVFYSFWNSANTRATQKASGLAAQLDRAAIAMKPQEIVLSVLGIGAVIWLAANLLLHPPFLLAAVLLPVIVLLTAGGFYSWVQFRIKRRLDAFGQQLELALRTISSGVRVGLGMRQAFTLVTEELTDPSRTEFMRVIGQTNIGVSIHDAIDDLAARMPSNESLMMAKVMRVQSTTGGDLGKVLDHLAGTIKDRRRVERKIGALTAEGRMSCLVLMLIPVCLGAFIAISQPVMGHALLFTGPGHIVLIALAVLEAGGYLWLKNIMRMDV
jgi:tight adherence protein B